MIFKRAVAKLRAQDWMAIVIEFAIVVAGVFVGTWVANWNAERADKAQVERLITQLQPKLSEFIGLAADDQAYYAVVRGYAKVAKAGWARGSAVSDRDFVVAAFQATEISPFNNNPFYDGSLLSVEEVRKVDDTALRERLLTLISYRSGFLDLFGEGSAYREQVRSIIPDEVQQQILTDCGDKQPGPSRHFWLPKTCATTIEPAIARTTAAALRARPDLVQALTSHLSHVNRHLFSDIAYGKLLALVDQRITETRR
ncbi:MAG: hypothetical protein V4444_07740 [Pseudomonadota bacterium]